MADYIVLERKLEGIRRDLNSVLEEKNRVPAPAELMTRTLEQLKSWNDLLGPEVSWDYYRVLPEQDKEIYRRLLEGIIGYKESIPVGNIKMDNASLELIYQSLIYDNPAIFCLGQYAIAETLTESGRKIKIPSLCKGKAVEGEFRRRVFQSVKQILSTPGIYKKTERQKEKFVHDYLIRNCSYDFSLGDGGSRLEPYTVYGTLVNRNAVCEGIAKTTKLLLQLLGVQCQLVTGLLHDGGSHAWNVVKIDGKTYHLDVTHDMGWSSGKMDISYRYFNVSDTFMEKNRTWIRKDVIWECPVGDR